MAFLIRQFYTGFFYLEPLYFEFSYVSVYITYQSPSDVIPKYGAMEHDIKADINISELYERTEPTKPQTLEELGHTNCQLAI